VARIADDSVNRYFDKIRSKNGEIILPLTLLRGATYGSLLSLLHTKAPPISCEIKEATPTVRPDGSVHFTTVMKSDLSIPGTTRDFQLDLIVYERNVAGEIRAKRETDVDHKPVSLTHKGWTYEMIYPPSAEPGYTYHGYTAVALRIQRHVS
jgi:hypothetical protein